MIAEIKAELVLVNFFHIGGAIFRKDAMKGIRFDEEITYAEDRDFAIRMYKEKNAKFAVLHKQQRGNNV